MKTHMKIYRLLFLILLLPSLANAETKNFSADQIDLLHSAQIYMDNLQDVTARFIQFNPENSAIINGELYILRPGKLMMRYLAPYRIDYFIIDDNFVQYDYDLDQLTRADANKSPLNLLLYKGINLADNDLLDLTNIVDKGSYFEVYFTNKTEDLAEEISGLTLKFSKLPTELTGITRVDSQGNSTDLTFSKVRSNVGLESNIFEFERPKPKYPDAR